MNHGLEMKLADSNSWFAMMISDSFVISMSPLNSKTTEIAKEKDHNDLLDVAMVYK